MKQTLIVSLLLTMMVGCQSRPPANTYRYGSQPGLTIDQELANDLSVDETVSSHLGDLLQVQTIVTNRTKKQLAFEYRVEWFDERGMLLETPASRWVIRHIYGGEAMPLTAVAPAPNAVKWTLKLKKRL